MQIRVPTDGVNTKQVISQAGKAKKKRPSGKIGTTLPCRPNTGEKLLVGNLIQQILFPRVNKYGTKKTCGRIYSLRENLIQFLIQGQNGNWEYNRTTRLNIKTSAST